MEHADLIDALGGAAVVAERLPKLRNKKLTRDAVEKWQKRNQVPWRWRKPVAQLAISQGRSLPDDFGVIVVRAAAE